MTTTNPPTDQQLDAIEARISAATEGPWERHSEYGPTFFANITGPYLRGVGDFNFGVGEQAEADEEFVKHAREDVDVLLAEVRRLRAALTAIRHLHTDSPMGPCPLCINGDAAPDADPTVPWPCPTARLAGAVDIEPAAAAAGSV
jgi:hypothetical protein